MGRLLSFLACGVVVGFFAGAFQIPNMIPIMLVIFWIGMGAGLKLGYALVGAALMPLAIVLPMWCLPGPSALGRMYPPDDSRLKEMFIVEGADEIYERSLEAHRSIVEAYEHNVEEGLVPLADEKFVRTRPTLHDANAAVLARAKSEGAALPRFDIWPRRGAWVGGLLITLAAFAVNTFTTRPFRDPRPLGQD